MTRSLPLLKGTLDLLILKALSCAPTHGYGLANWLERHSDGIDHLVTRRAGGVRPVLFHALTNREETPVAGAVGFFERGYIRRWRWWW